MNLTKQQKIAIRNPCFEPEDCHDLRYYWTPIDPVISLGLTMNIGME